MYLLFTIAPRRHHRALLHLWHRIEHAFEHPAGTRSAFGGDDHLLFAPLVIETALAVDLPDVAVCSQPCSSIRPCSPARAPTVVVNHAFAAHQNFAVWRDLDLLPCSGFPIDPLRALNG